MNIENIPKIQCDFCTQEEFEHAIGVMAGCYTVNSEELEKGFFSPGANGESYGLGWWSLDYALIVDGAKWIDFNVAKDFVDNMLYAQCEDGRVKLYSADTFSKWHTPYNEEKIASIPKFLETSFQTAMMSCDEKYSNKVFDLINRNLNWWFEFRQDQKTKLISAMFEETFIPNTVSPPLVYAPMDTNYEIINGCKRAATLAKKLGCLEKADFYNNKGKEIAEAVEAYLWCEKDFCYYPYILTQKKHQPTLMASTFLGFNTANTERKTKLSELLLDNDQFNWETYPLTTLSKKDPLFTEVAGAYNGNPSWSGSVWTLTNVAVIKALLNANKKDLALQLALKTVNCFKDNYYEFVNPFTRSGEGVKQYGWTAAQFIQIIIEFIFGISYDSKTGVSVNPLFLQENNTMSIENIVMPNGKRYKVCVNGLNVEIQEMM